MKTWRVWQWTANRLPRKLVEWAVIRAFAHGTTGIFKLTMASELTVVECLRRWDRDNYKHEGES